MIKRSKWVRSYSLSSGEGRGEVYGVIGGGSFNTVSACYSSILGGTNNNISDNYSAILGGKGNTVSHAYAAAFGCNVSSVVDCAFHANNFVAQNIPSSAPATARTFYIHCTGGICYVAIT